MTSNITTLQQAKSAAVENPVERVAKHFLARMHCNFRKVSDDPEQAAMTFIVYAEELQKYDNETLIGAARKLIAERTDPWMPTVAECLEACRQVYNNSPATR